MGMAAASGESVIVGGGGGGGYGIYCGGLNVNLGTQTRVSAASSSTCLQQQQQMPLDGGGFFTSAVVAGTSSAPILIAAGTSNMVSFEDARPGSKRPDLNSPPTTNNFFTPYITATDFCLDDTTACFGCDEDEFDEYFHLHPSSSSSSKKRRLTSDQVRFLERSFEAENKLEPERKVQLAKDLGLQPRQVAIWFQNRRARWKNKRLEKDFECLQSRFCKLKGDFESLVREKDQLEAQVVQLSGKLRGKGSTVKLLANDDNRDQPAAGQHYSCGREADSDNRFRTSSTEPVAAAAVVVAVAVDTSSASEAESTSWQQQQEPPSMTFLISPDDDLTAHFEPSTTTAAESPFSYVVDHCSHHYLVVADFLSQDHHCYAAAAAASFEPSDGSDVSDQDKVEPSCCGVGGFNDDVVVGFDSSSQFGVRAVGVEEDTAEEEEDDHRPPWIWSY